MKAKVNRTIMNRQIQSVKIFRSFNRRLKKNVTTGFIWLSEEKRIRIEGAKFFLINNHNQVEGIVLKSNPGYKRIKRIIARWFKWYRINGNCEHASYWRSRAIDGIHNINLFRNSEIKFLEHPTDFLKLAS